MSAPSLQLVPAAQSRRPPAAELGRIAFSSLFSDHMLTAEHRDGAWNAASIRPYGELALAPNVSALQYAVSIFEGLKAHRLPDGRIALFRPWENARRMNRSARRLAMPELPEETFVQWLHALLRVDGAWVPPAGEGALYIRPCMFSIDPSVRVKPAERFLFVIFTFPFGLYYTAPVDVLATERYVRAFPGGTGEVKPAGNYAPTVLAESEARAAGFHTVMWLDGVHRRFVEECGVMNVFFRIGEQIVTPSLEGTILPGVTRDSAITILRDMGCEVVERRIAIDEVVAAHDRGELRECFGTGTAATLSHIQSIGVHGRRLALPPADQRPVANELRRRLVAIASGLEPDTHGWVDVLS